MGKLTGAVTSAGSEIIGWLADLGTSLVIEFVTKNDPMVQMLLCNKRDNYADYEPENLQRCLSERCHIARSEPLAGGTRTLCFEMAKP